MSTPASAPATHYQPRVDGRGDACSDRVSVHRKLDRGHHDCAAHGSHRADHGRAEATDRVAVVVGKDSGLRTQRRVSHTFVFDLPDHSQPILMADCVVNINPNLMDKRDITQNAIDLAHTLGIERPYVGILSALETINPAIPGTIDAAVLSKMAERGQITGAIVEGPLSFDVAISLEAAQIKGVDLQNRGRPDGPSGGQSRRRRRLA